jgi:hypothetical protein
VGLRSAFPRDISCLQKFRGLTAYNGNEGATAHPDRVYKLVVLSVPHPLAPRTLRQREMAWYWLFFRFEGIAEAWLQHDDWAGLPQGSSKRTQVPPRTLTRVR